MIWLKVPLNKQSQGADQTMRKKDEKLSSVTTAFRLLKAFSKDQSEISISNLARELGVAKSTVHRLAAALISAGFLDKNPENNRYKLGIGLFRLATLVRRRMDLTNEARPYLFDLRGRTGETILLGIPTTDDEIMYVYNLESTHAVRFSSDIGVRRPVHCTAIGRAIFAFMPDTAIDRLLSGPLIERTTATITDRERLWGIFRTVRERGYAVEDEESEPGIRCIAAPILGESGSVIGAVGIAGPSQRNSLKKLESYSPILIDAAISISRRIGNPGM